MSISSSRTSTAVEVDGQLLFSANRRCNECRFTTGIETEFSKRLVLDPGVIPNDAELSDSLFILYEALKSNEKLTLEEVRAISQIKNPMPLVQKALNKNWAILEEELKKVARAKRKLLKISPDVLNRLDDAFSATSKSEKQTQALLSLVAACGSENNWIDSRAFRKKNQIESPQLSL